LDAGPPGDDSSAGACQLVYNVPVRPFLQVEDCGLKARTLDVVELPNGLANCRGGL
jgi:hypothetical protein